MKRISFLICFLFGTFAVANSIVKSYTEDDIAELNCSEEYNETISIENVNYSRRSICMHSDTFGVRNLCSGLPSCRFNVTNGNIGSSCGRGTASLNITYTCIRNGEWTHWTESTPCSVTCGGGVINITRNCTNPAPNEFGDMCVGKTHDVYTCHENDCIHDEVSCINSNLTWICQEGYIDVLSAQWKTHADCIGFQTYKAISVINRLKTLCGYTTMCTFIVGDSAFGKSCSTLASTCSRLDYVYSCKRPKWSEWSEWSNCSRSCGSGIQTRTRYCINPMITRDGYRINCKGSSSDERLCNTKPCIFCGNQTFLSFDLELANLQADTPSGTGCILFGEKAKIGCCGRIKIFEFIPVNTGTLSFIVWRKTRDYKYRVVGSNKVQLSASDLNKHGIKRHIVPEKEQIAVQNGDILGWHDDGDGIIGYADCYPSNETCSSSIIRTTGSSPKHGDEIDTENMNKVSNRIYAVSYSTTTNRAPFFLDVYEEIIIQDHIPIDSKVADVPMLDPDYGDYFRNIKFDVGNEYFYFDTKLRSLYVKSKLPHIEGKKNLSHIFTLKIEDSCFNEVTANITLVTYNSPPKVEKMMETLFIDSSNIQNSSVISTFKVTDLSGDSVACKINSTMPLSDIFLLETKDNDVILKLYKPPTTLTNSIVTFDVDIICNDGTDFIDIKRRVKFSPRHKTFDALGTDQNKIVILSSIVALLFTILLIISIYSIWKRRQNSLSEKRGEAKVVCNLTNMEIEIEQNSRNHENTDENGYTQLRPAEGVEQRVIYQDLQTTAEGETEQKGGKNNDIDDKAYIQMTPQEKVINPAIYQNLLIHANKET